MISKSLSYLLRHGAIKSGLKMRDDGFVALSEILAMPKFRGVSEDQIREIVASCPKQRFKLNEEDGKLYIRANQGHSIQVKKLDLKPITNPDEAPIVVHGTYYKPWDLIKKTGLSRMSRTHIHFAAGEPGTKEVISGMRNSAQVFIYVDIKEALKDGIPFFRSENNVILSPGPIAPYYFHKVVDVGRGGALLEFEKIKLQYDLPPSTTTTTTMTAVQQQNSNSININNNNSDTNK
eukprot:GEZU01025977.1.p1 GENE.GEZU01025977.1~~GEZU01025977.1.p1  ORF type:complete len:235 (+),score=76.74 GEZU01025977.1:507-1211(+)